MAKVTFDVLANSKATGFDETNRKIAEQAALAKKSADDSKKQYSALITSAAALASTIGPLGAVAGTAMAGVAASGGVALLAFQGLRKEWQQGTLQSTALGKQIGTLGDNLTKLEGTAAGGVAPGLTQGLKSINSLIPTVNADVKVMSGELGVISGNTGAAAVGLFRQMAPALESVGASLAAGSAKFKQWANSSQSVAQFAAFGQQELPIVAGVLTNVAVDAGHVVEALSPLGSSTLRAVELFSGSLRAIPIGVLTTALPLLTGAFVGGRLGGQASQGLDKFAKNLGTIGSEGSTTAKVMGGLGKVVGNLGPYGLIAGAALAGLGTIMGRADTNAAKFRAEVNKVTEALQTGSAAQAAWVAAQNTGASAATKYGLSQQQVITQVQTGQHATASYTEAVKNLKDRQLGLQEQLFRQQQQFGNTSKEALATGAALQDVTTQLTVLTNKVSTSAKEYAAAKKQLADWAKAQGDAGLQAEIATGAYQKNASSLFATQNAYLQGKLAADQFKVSTAANTVAMQLENNAAGLLNASLQALGGNSLGVAQTSTSAALANHAAAAAFKKNGDAIRGTSAAALANQQALEGAAAAAIQHGQAVAQQTGSTEKATSAINADKAALENNLRSQHALTPAVQAYIDTLFRIPASKKTTIDLNADRARAAAQGLLDLINSIPAVKYSDVIIRTNKIAAGSAGTNLAARASGGAVTRGKKYLVDELGPELFVPNSGGAYIIPGNGPHMWTAPSSGQIITAATVHSLRNRVSQLASSPLQSIQSLAQSAITAFGNVLPFGSPITRSLQSVDNALAALVAKRADLAKKLQAANQQLTNAEQQWGQEFTKVQQAVIGSFDITNAGKDVFGRTSAAGIISDLSAQVSQSNLFAGDLERLRKRHVNSRLLQQLAEAGPAASIASLQALVGATPAQLRQLNSLQNMLGNVGTVAGTGEANQLFGAQVAGARTLIRNLNIQIAGTVIAEKDLQRTIVQALERYLNSGGRINGLR